MPSAVTDSLKIGPGPKGFAANFVYEISKHGCYERETDGLVQQVAFYVSVSLMFAFAKCWNVWTKQM
jgi:hypothetical protein